MRRRRQHRRSYHRRRRAGRGRAQRKVWRKRGRGSKRMRRNRRRQQKAKKCRGPLCGKKNKKAKKPKSRRNRRRQVRRTKRRQYKGKRTIRGKRMPKRKSKRVNKYSYKKRKFRRTWGHRVHRSAKRRNGTLVRHNNHFGVHASASFMADTAGVWQFRFGLDFSFGTTVRMDGKTKVFRGGDIWWAHNWRNKRNVVSFKQNLDKNSKHTIEVVGFEVCCDGSATWEFKKPGGSWQIFSTRNVAFAEPQALNCNHYKGGIPQCPKGNGVKVRLFSIKKNAARLPKLSFMEMAEDQTTTITTSTDASLLEVGATKAVKSEGEEKAAAFVQAVEDEASQIANKAADAAVTAADGQVVDAAAADRRRRRRSRRRHHRRRRHSRRRRQNRRRSFRRHGSWKKCAGEHGTCKCHGVIRYGIHGRYSYRHSHGRTGCNNSVFGDPFRGRFKHCHCQRRGRGMRRMARKDRVRRQKGVRFLRTRFAKNIHQNQGNFKKWGLSHNFGVNYETLLLIPRAGMYKFWTASDDGSKLWINGRQVVDNDGLHGRRYRSGSIYLRRGRHRLRADVFQRGGDSNMSVYFQGPGMKSKQLIPEDDLCKP